MEEQQGAAPSFLFDSQQADIKEIRATLASIAQGLAQGLAEMNETLAEIKTLLEPPPEEEEAQEAEGIEIDQFGPDPVRLPAGYRQGVPG